MIKTLLVAITTILVKASSVSYLPGAYEPSSLGFDNTTGANVTQKMIDSLIKNAELASSFHNDDIRGNA